eukprot:1426247-Pleurochrysis_carterae.AAC.1
MHEQALKQQRAGASAKQKALLQPMQGERDDSSTKVTRLEREITELQRMLNHAHAAASAANKENAAA